MRKTQLLLALAAIGFAGSAFATNGMNLEGYGPISLGMGGASFAYDNGNAAVMNNPATLGLGAQGNRFDLAVGMLGPDVTSTCASAPCTGAVAASSGDAYYMPALGWSNKDGAMTYGVGLMAQGGMGTEYAATTFMAGGSGSPVRSELGVGRLIFPLAYNVNPDLTIGGSLDYVWAMMDMKMAASGAQLGSMVTGATGAIAGALGPLAAAPWARIDFSDSSDYTGKAKATGFAGKLGFTYRVSPSVTIGGTYHSKTNLSDMETSSSGASMSAPGPFLDSGKISVRDFQWPETYGLGIAVQATPSLLIAADVKQINWADVMKSFKMTYTSSGLGGTVDFAMPQNWDDQTVFSLGMSYKLSEPMTLRLGANFSNNPIPSSWLNALFPAIEKNHYTVGLGYAFSNTSELNFALSFADEVTQTNPGAVAPPTAAVTVDHSQISWQLMYSKRF
jgi:long-chain fatty acid transport protein